MFSFTQNKLCYISSAAFLCHQHSSISVQRINPFYVRVVYTTKLVDDEEHEHTWARNEVDERGALNELHVRYLSPIVCSHESHIKHDSMC